jgi:hypothetical protein
MRADGYQAIDRDGIMLGGDRAAALESGTSARRQADSNHCGSSREQSLACIANISPRRE